jgi:hypothetical protein
MSFDDWEDYLAKEFLRRVERKGVKDDEMKIGVGNNMKMMTSSREMKIGVSNNMKMMTSLREM